MCSRGVFASVLSSLFALCVASTAFADDSAVVTYDGECVIRADIRSARDLRTLLAIAEEEFSHRIDLGEVDFRVKRARLAALTAAGIRFEMRVPDLAEVVRNERVRLAAAAEGSIAGDASWFADFKTIAQINAKLDEWAIAHPSLVSSVTAGASLEGRVVRGIRISSTPVGANVPAVLFDAGQHAREWIGPMTAMFLANALIDGASSNARIARILSTCEIFILPSVNPDGYEHTWTTARLWRKNRRDNGNGTFGVDPNRNWGFQWGRGGASTDPASETYRGTAAFSEPETQSLRDFFYAHPNIVGHMDYHSYSQLVLWPWGYTTTAPLEAPAFDAIADRMSATILANGGQPYIAGQVATTLYIASGSIIDWVYGDRAITSLTIELRDTGTTGFVLPPEQIIPTGVENVPAALDLIEATAFGCVIGFPDALPTLLPYNETAEVRFSATPMPGVTAVLSKRAFARVGSGAYNEVAVVTAADVSTATLPTNDCGAIVEYYFECTTARGMVRAPAMPNTAYSASVTSSSLLFEDSFETSLGWTVGATGDTATGGVWTRVDPNATAAQPENDSSDAGAMCFITGQGAVGGALGSADVDGGATTLTSPLLNASDADAVLTYRRWYSNNMGGAPNADSMPISISNDGGASWVLLEDVTENANAWVERSVRVANFVTPSASVRVRCVARDLASGSVVEAGFDFVRVSVTGCPSNPSDINGDGSVDASDLAQLLGAWGLAGVTDIDGSGVTNAADLAMLLGNWS